MSDTEASPSKNRNRETLHIDDYSYQDREPKCVNSLCNLINSRLKVLESEIVAQHKVWESIQKEVDEVKSLIEDCTSTCGSSSSSAQGNESENVDSALESHRTCNSLLWNKLKQAEENVEEKKSLMRMLSNDVSKLKNSKKRCSRRHSRTKSNVDLILEVTNGLHVLKCSSCKFCSEHLDFRESLLSAVIELVHFTEKNHSHSVEENKALKSCLQRIYVKTKSCLLHSQIYQKNNQPHSSFDTDNHTVDNVYTSFEEFCQHFQNLQDELLQLRQILLAAEENQLDELFQDSHSTNCVCYNFMKKGDAHSSRESDKNEAKFSKNLTYSDENDEDVDVTFDPDQIFKLSDSETSKQLENLRNGIYEAVRTIRDVEVEENDDRNLICMVASLAEECSALRQEVSYLRDVRQEKKRSWNKLQCFIMDAERKLKDNRTVSGVKEVIRDLRQILSSNESSSLDETILYMYSNQLEWMEKLSTIKENPCEEEVANNAEGWTEMSYSESFRESNTLSCRVGCENFSQFFSESGESNESTVRVSVDGSAQTLLTSSSEISKDYHTRHDIEVCDIGIQVEGVFEYFTTEASKEYESAFNREINREIYVVPEAVEENDSCDSSSKTDDKDVITDEPLTSELTSESAVSPEAPEKPSPESASHASGEMPESASYFPGTFSDSSNYGELVPHKSSRRFSLPLINMSDASFSASENEYWSIFSGTNNPFHNSFENSMYIYMFMNQQSDLSHKFNSLFYSMLRGAMSPVETPEGDKNWSCIILQLGDSPLTLNSSTESVKYLPYLSAFASTQSGEVKSGSDKCSKYDTQDSQVICREIIFKSDITDITNTSSSSSDEKQMPNTSTDSENDSEANNPTEPLPSEAAIIDSIEDQIIKDSEDKADDDGSMEAFTSERRPQACREGTFILEPSESVHFSHNQILGDNMYYTAILTTLVSSSLNSSEKNYVLFEICKSQKSSTVDEFQSDEEVANDNLEDKPSVQHFVLCEVDQDDTTKGHQITSDICHIIFCKSNMNVESKHIFDISSGNNSSFNPLVPQYLPLETFNYDMFQSLSLTHNCEIYASDTKGDINLNNEEENALFIPKQFLKFKSSLTSNKDPQSEEVNETIERHYVASEYAVPFDFPSEHLNSIVASSAADNQNIDSAEDVSETRDNEGQMGDNVNADLQASPDADHQEHSEEQVEGETSIREEISENAKASNEVESSANETEGTVENQARTEENEAQAINKQHVTIQTEQSTNETSLLDEITALKENLGHQNAVLQRLKEELEDSNIKLDRKEGQLQIMQLELSRLSEAMFQHNIKEIDDKKCQTEFPDDYEKYENLKKEVNTLRQENMQHHAKILNQSKTIQHVKAQLCATISHLKTLKESASKQLKKQKQDILKTLKVKQQLQDTKMTLEKKCEEIEKKNEIISDQEFQIHEMQARLDSTMEELSRKSDFGRKTSVSIRVDNETQTQFLVTNAREEEKKPVTEQDIILKKHSEELHELQAKLQQLESVFSNKKDFHRNVYEEHIPKSSHELKIPSHLKEGNIWKLLMISEQSYLSLLSKLSESLQIMDLKGAVTLMHSSWLNCEELADARRQDHKKILQSLDKLKRSIRYLQESHHLEHRRQNAESAGSDEKKCHSEEMHFQYLCDVLQRAQENLVKEYSQKKISHQRTIVTPGSLRSTRHGNSRERRIPLELKNGKILALLDDKVNQKDLLPNKHDFNKMESKAGTSSFKSKSSS